MPEINKKLITFVLILIVISSFFRFYKLQELSYWMFDEERDAFVVKKILVDHHPTLIGGSIPGGFYLAPGYFYISSIFYFLSGGNPLGPAIAASALGVLSTLLLFTTTLKFFNRKTAIFASLIYATSYLAVIYNRTWWPLTFAPLVSLLTYLSLFNIIKYKKYKWVIPLSLALIVGAHSDPSNFSLIILTVIVFFIFRLSWTNKFVLWGVCLFIISHLPLLLFDLRHNFLNSKQFLKMVSFGQNAGLPDFSQSLKGLEVLWQTFARFIFVSKNPDMALQIVPAQYYLETRIAATPKPLLLITLIILSWFAIKFSKTVKGDNLPVKIIGLHLIVAIAGVILYNTLFPGYTQEWFFQVLFPAFAIIIGAFLSQLAAKRIGSQVAWGALVIYLFFAAVTILGARNSYGFAHKSQAVKWAIKEVSGEPFSLDSIGQNFSWGGYRYLFYLYGHEPQKSYMDPVFADWMYPKSQLSQTHPDKVVVIVNPDFFADSQFQEKYNRYLGKTIVRQKFGIIEVLIIDNSESWVTW